MSTLAQKAKQLSLKYTHVDNARLELEGVGGCSFNFYFICDCVVCLVTKIMVFFNL